MSRLMSRGRTRREAAKAETRQALIDAGIALYAEQGLDGPSLDAICKHAGYTRGAFYVHFGDRDDFMVAVMEEVMRDFLATIQQTAERRHDLERSIETFAALYEALRAVAPGEGEPLPEGAPLAVLGVSRLHLILEAAGRSEQVRVRFAALVQEGIGRVADAARAGQEAGTVRADVRPEQAGVMLVTQVVGLMALAQTGVPVDIGELKETLLRLVRPG